MNMEEGKVYIRISKDILGHCTWEAKVKRYGKQIVVRCEKAASFKHGDIEKPLVRMKIT